jgi:hypothetical protein
VPKENDNTDLSKDVFRVLLDLYGVVIALALTTAIGLTVSPEGIALSPLMLNWKYLALFGTIFVTIVPFYHGASVYLLWTYKHGNPSPNRAAPLVDFFALTFEGVFFYAMAASTKNLNSFALWFALLLLLDIVWVGVTYLKATTKTQAPKWWAILNTGMVLVLTVTYGIDTNTWPQIFSVIFAAAVIRTCTDYILNYDYYFPKVVKS